MRAWVAAACGAALLAGCGGGDGGTEAAGEVFGPPDGIGEDPIGLIVKGRSPTTVHAPADRAIETDGRRVWIARANAAVETDEKARRVGRRPVALSFAHGTLWVLDDADNVVRGLDPVTLEQRRRIRLPRDGDVAPGAGPTDIAADARFVWVTDNTLHTVAKYSIGTGKLVDSFETGAEPEAVAIGSDGAYTADQGEGTVTRIANGEAEQIDLLGDASPVHLAVDGNRIWVADQKGFVHLIEDGEERTAPVDVSGASALAIDDGYVWVLSNADGTLTRIKPN